MILYKKNELQDLLDEKIMECDKTLDDTGLTFNEWYEARGRREAFIEIRELLNK